MIYGTWYLIAREINDEEVRCYALFFRVAICVKMRNWLVDSFSLNFLYAAGDSVIN